MLRPALIMQVIQVLNASDSTGSKTRKHRSKYRHSDERRRRAERIKRRRRKLRSHVATDGREKKSGESGELSKSVIEEASYTSECNRSKEIIERVKIEGVSYIRGKKIAKAGSGSVWLAIREEDETNFALKEVNLRRNGEILRGEVDRLQVLKNAPHIIRLIAHDMTSNKLVLRMILELGEIDLECELKRQKGKFDKITTRTFALEIGKGIKEMHDQSIIHLDIKLANILIVRGTLKIMDLGLSATLPEKTDFIVRDFMFGSNRPPEQIVPQQDGTYKLTKKVDIWGFGVIVFQMTYGRKPFSSQTSRSMIAILDPNVRIQHDLGADPLITEFFEMCTVREVEKRATIDQLLKHQYLAKASTTKAPPREELKAESSHPVKQETNVVNPGGVTPQTISTTTNPPESGPPSLPELSDRKSD